MSPSSQPSRLPSIDWMRGLVMVLMALDHASIFYNAGREAADTAAAYVPGTAIDPLQFFARWITHLCAPTFLFLAGTALALSTSRRRARGQSERSIDKDLFIRGLVIAGIELGFLGAMAPIRLFSVLFAIGVSMIAMIGLRRLPLRLLLAIALTWFVAGEAVTSLVWQGEGDAPVWAALLLARNYGEQVHAIYPVTHWLAMMVLGWVFGGYLLARRERGRGLPIRPLLIWGFISLDLFLMVRGLGGYGNMWLQADDNSLVQWLHVSKYPPSLAFISLELGLMAWCLAGFMWLQGRVEARPNGLLLVLGQTALFFYVLHFLCLGISGIAFRVTSGGDPEVAPGGLGLAALAAVCVVALLYPACRWFRSFKRARPESWVRFI
jgi:uncharacterized membrane protein